MTSPDFVARVSNFPLFNTALRAYEHGKASSRVVKVSLLIKHTKFLTPTRFLVRRRNDGIISEDYIPACH